MLGRAIAINIRKAVATIPDGGSKIIIKCTILENFFPDFGSFTMLFGVFSSAPFFQTTINFKRLCVCSTFQGTLPAPCYWILPEI